MRRIFIVLLFSAITSSLVFCSGCTSTKTAGKSDDRAISRDKDIQIVDKDRVELIKEVDNTENIDSKVNLEESVARDDKTVLRLKSGVKTSENPSETRDEIDGFKSTEERTIVYGPVGFVLQLTEWILTKLYIMHSD